jgi:hypothetical protein
MPREELTSKQKPTSVQTDDHEQVRLRREQIAKQVQQLLTEQLQKHAIEPERAKEIAYKVVDMLKDAGSILELEQVLPSLANEFQELHRIIYQDLFHHKQEVEKQVIELGRKLILERNFEAMIALAEQTVKAHTQSDLTHVQAECDNLLGKVPEALNAEDTEQHPEVSEEEQMAENNAIKEIEASTHQPHEAEISHTMTSEETKPLEEGVTDVAGPATSVSGVPIEGSNAPVVTRHEEFPPQNEEIVPEPDLHESIQNKAGELSEKMKPMLDKAKVQAQKVIENAPETMKGLADKGKELGTRIIDQVKEKMKK